MEHKLKQRLIGAATLITAGVIFIPMLLDDTDAPTVIIEDLSLPPPPKDIYDSGVQPLDEEKLLVPPVVKLPPAAEAEDSPGAETPAISRAGGREAGAARAVTIGPPNKPKSKPKDTSATAKRVESAGGAPPSARRLPGAVAAAPPATDKQRLGVTAWAIQLGSFSSEENAKLLEQRLKNQGFKAFVEKLYMRPGTVFRVRVGPELDEAKAKQLQARLEKEISLKGILVRYP
ncbi:MAG: Cell division protein DedD [Chromatiales bacterium USCg_Taylor]|nr:MAG: Cell division protein DedD [Chromatiales bacterium USCg_Taylor]